MSWIEITYSDLVFCRNQMMIELEKQISILNASVLTPLSECTEVPPVLESAVNNLRELVSSCLLHSLSSTKDRSLISKVKEAEVRCQGRQQDRSRLGRIWFADR